MMQTAREREEEWLLSMAETLSPDEMPSEALQLVAQTIGVRAAVRLALTISGIPLYIPRSATTMLKRMYVKKVFDGTNARRLAQQLGLAERTVRDWTSKPSSTAPDQANQQLALPLAPREDAI